MTDVLVIAANEDDALEFALRRKPEGHITLVWDTCMAKVIQNGPFDKLIVTTAAQKDPRVQTWIAAVRTRLRGPDGKTPAERIER